MPWDVAEEQTSTGVIHAQLVSSSEISLTSNNTQEADQDLARRWHRALIKTKPAKDGSTKTEISYVSSRSLKKYLAEGYGFFASLMNQLDQKVNKEAKELFGLLRHSNFDNIWAEQLTFHFTRESFIPKPVADIPVLDQCIELYREQKLKTSSSSSLIEQTTISPMKRKMLEKATKDNGSFYAARKLLAADLLEMHQCVSLEGKKRIYQKMIVCAFNMTERFGLPGWLLRAEATMLYIVSRFKDSPTMDPERQRLVGVVIDCLLRVEHLAAKEKPETILKAYGEEIISLEMALAEGKALASGKAEFSTVDALIFTWARDYLFPSTVKLEEITSFIDERRVHFKNTIDSVYASAQNPQSQAKKLGDCSFLTGFSARVNYPNLVSQSLVSQSQAPKENNLTGVPVPS